MKELQTQHREWLKSMYPEQPRCIPAAGCVEEAGELLHAVLKMEQNRLWGEELRYPKEKLDADLVDAIGDCAIFFCSLCNSAGWEFERFTGICFSLKSALPNLELAATLVSAAARLSVSCTAEDGEAYIRTLKRIAFRFDVDFEGAVRSTWETVRRRTRCVRST